MARQHKQKNDDLFAESTMTFGEHLEELRSALIKALTGLAIGFIIGLLGAQFVVDRIKDPLEKALKKYYVDRAIIDLTDEYGEEFPTATREFIKKNQIRFQEFLIEANEVNRLSQLIAERDSDISRLKDGESPTVADGQGGGSVPAVDEAGRNTLIDESLPPPSSDLMLTRFWSPLDTGITALSAQEVFIIWLKAAFVAGVVISSPWVFWHLWQFVAAGLYLHEKRYVYVFLPFSILLFLSGVLLAYFFVFEPVLDFLFGFNQRMNIDPDPRISEWLGFVLFLPLGFGISFQLPLVMLFLERIGVFSVESYLSRWRVAVLVIFVIAMLLTPADPVSMMLMAVPLTFLYFLGVVLCRWMPAIRRPMEVPVPK